MPGLCTDRKDSGKVVQRIDFLILPVFSGSQVLYLGLCGLVGKALHVGEDGKQRVLRRDLGKTVRWNTAFLLLLGNLGSSFVVTYFVLGFCFVFLPLIQFLNIDHVPSIVTSTGEAAMSKVLASVKLKSWQAYLSCQYLLFSQKP